MTSVGVRTAAARFNLGEPLDVTPVNEAWSNEVFRVRTTTAEYAVKLFPPGLDVSRVRALHDAMGFEAAVLESGLVPMPRPVETSGSWLAEIPSRAGTRLARCHEWVDGTAASVAERTAEFIGRAGHTLGVLHAFQRPGGDSSQLPGLDWERWHRAVRSAATAGFAWAPRLAALTPVVEQLAGRVDQVRAERRPMQFSHRDFDPKNAIRTGTGLAITDWDYAGPVLPEVELVTAAMSFADPADPDGSVREFVTAYRAAGGDAVAADPTGLAVEAAEVDWLLRNVEACVRAGQDDDDDENLAMRHQTVADLISEYEGGTAELEAWAERVADVA